MPGSERFRPPHHRREAADAQNTAIERRDELLQRLEQAIGAIHDSESFRRYLDAQARFHDYSFGNVALIVSQRPDATAVAGYNAWLRLHRYVRKGEKGIRILAPMTRKEEPEEEGGKERHRLFFRPVSVFDVSQTEGEPLPEVAVPLLEGENGGGLMDGLLDFALRAGVQVRLSRGELPAAAAGAYWPDGQKIRVRAAPMRQMTKTLAHELAHHVHHTLLGGEPAEREARETVAESVAYVVCGHFGLDTGERSFPYVASWAKDRAVFKAALGSIQKVSATLINGVEARSLSHSLPPQLLAP